MTWRKGEVDQERVRELSRRFGVDKLTATIFCRRGITSPYSLRFYLESDLRLLHNPFLMQPMVDAVERLKAALESGEKILIFGDRDVDGITATVLLHQVFTELGADVQWMLPEGEDAYGLTPKVVEKAAQLGINLLVTVDCGISNAEEIALAASRGIETVVVDHHNPPAKLPDAVAIVNPKLAGSTYPFADLCGCAVASKLEWALRFARSPFFGTPFTLLNARPANETVMVEAIRVVNLVVVDRISENVVPGMVPLEKTRLSRFLAVGGGELLALDVPTQARLLQLAFGDEVALPLSDLSPLVSQYLPGLAGKSLLRIQQESSRLRFAEKPASEIETLAELFAWLVLAKEKPLLEPAFKSLDLVTLGTLADLMPLADENRVFVKEGLNALRRPERSGLRHVFLRKDLLGKRIGTTEIAWQIAPLLNSAGRMGEPGKATRLFLSKIEEEIQDLVEQLFALDGKRRSMGEAVWGFVLGSAKDSYQHTEGRCVLVADGRIQRGITGVMASRLQSFFKVPAIVIAAGGENAVGSIRSARDGFVDEFFGRFSGHFANFGGHNFAGGFSLAAGNLPAFLESFSAGVGQFEIPAAQEETIFIDAEIPISYLTPELQKVVDLFEPFGEGNPPLSFLTRRMRILQCDLIGRKELVHLKMLLEAGPLKWPAVYWNGGPRLETDFRVGDTVDVVYRLGRNSYGGTESIQLTVVDIQKSGNS